MRWSTQYGRTATVAKEAPRFFGRRLCDEPGTQLHQPESTSAFVEICGKGSDFSVRSLRG